MKPVEVDDSVAGEVVELRIHGVSGTKPQDMLGDPYPRQVAGDEAARIFRRTTPIVEPFHGRQRVVEGLHWGRFTSGAASRALWLLLVPFALINLARYAMLLPHEAGPRAARDRASTLVLRLLGLALTLLLVVSAGFVGWAIGAPKFSWWDSHSGYRVLLGALPCLLVVALTWWFGRQVFIHEPPGGLQPWRTPYGSFDDVGFWTGSPTSSRHRAAHTVASLGITGLLALALVPMPTWRTWSWLFFFLLVVGNAIAIATGLVVIGDDSAPEGAAPASTSSDNVALPSRLVSLRRWLALPATVLAVMYAAWAVDQNDRPVLWSVPTTEAVSMVSLVVAVLLLVFAATCAWQLSDAAARRLKAGEAGNASYPLVPKAFRPFWFGWGPWLLTAVAAFLAFGLSTVAVFWASKVAGGVELPVVFSYSAVVWGVVAVLVLLALVPVAAAVLQRPAAAVLWVLGLVLVGVAGALDAHRDKVTVGDVAYLAGPVVLALALRLMLGHRVPDPFDDALTADYPADGPDDGGGTAALERGREQVRARWFITESRTRYHWVIGVLAGISALSLVGAGIGSAGQLWFWFGPDGRRGDLEAGRDSVPASLLGLGIAVLSLIASSLIALGLSTWRDPEKRRTVGIIWDLLSFWPRDAHPLCPPPYGGRAVLGAATRAVQLTEDEEGGGLGASSVVLSGHSQGSLIGVASVAVLARLDPSTQNSPPQDTAGNAGESFWLERSRAERAMLKVSLVTYGSQLQFLYGRLFPTYFGFGRLTWLYSEALRRTPAGTPLPPERLSRWRNIYRWTDPLGAPVLSWPLDGERPGPQTVRWTTVACAAEDPCPGHLPEAQNSPLRGVEHRWYVIGPDIRLVDPAVVVESAFEPRLAPRGHSDYPMDPVFDAIVADLATPPPPPREEIDLTTPTDVTDEGGPTASGAEPPPTATVGPEATDHQRVDDWGTSAS